MCVNITYFPLMRDTITGKQHIEFKYPIDINDYADFQHLHKKEFAIKYKNLFGMSGNFFSVHDEIVKLVQVPCGRCSECLNNKAKGLMFRIMKEASFHSSNYFVTLTYDDEHLPKNFSLIKDEISKFNKKLKIYLARKNMKSDFRFYGVGEYGGTTARPHYHVIYFGLELDDLVYYKSNEFGQPLFNSEFLSNVWSKGFVVVGEVDVGSAAYVARYTEKKQFLTKERKEELINKGIVPEFSVQSMRPGIGANYLSNVVVSLKNLVYNENIKGTSFSFPKYYIDKAKKVLEYSPELLAYESYTDFLSSCKRSKFLLAYDSSYNTIMSKVEKDKLHNKNKRNGF